MAFDYLYQKLPTTPSAIQTELDTLGVADWELICIDEKPTGSFAILKKTV